MAKVEITDEYPQRHFEFLNTDSVELYPTEQIGYGSSIRLVDSVTGNTTKFLLYGQIGWGDA